jgi:hypothetical protein
VHDLATLSSEIITSLRKENEFLRKKIEELQQLLLLLLMQQQTDEVRR